VARGATAPTEDARGRGGRRFANFLRASWAELQRVQWPDRRQVGQATAVVLGFVVIAGAFLGLADVVAEQVVDILI
jgi:preprotein translocase SecE subunit